MLKLAQNTSISTEPIYKFQNNHSVEFDGVDDFIQLGEPISYTQHTISTWVKITAGDSSSTIIDSRDASNDGIRIRVTPEERIEYELNASHLTTTGSYSGEWIHIVATYDGTTQKLYINANLDQSATTEQEISTTTNAEIGARNFSDRANEFAGKIDELAIWNRALSAEEIEEIYRIKYGANLIQNGRFDELSDELVSNPNFTMGADLIQNGSLDELGSELIPDGNFTSQSAVDFWSIATTDSEPRATKSFQNGFLRLTFVNVGTPPAANGSALFKSGIVTSGKSYKVTFRAKGTATVNFGSIGDNNNISSNPQYVISNPNLTTSFQDYEFYVPVTSTTFRLYLVGSVDAGQTLDITNISVKQLDPNDRWTLDTGWAYSNNGVTCSSGNGTFQTNGLTLTASTFHKLTFDIVTYESGTLKVDLGSSSYDATFTSAGSKTIFMNAAGLNRPRFYGGAFRGTISNITVQEISGWNIGSRRGFAIDSNGHLEINSSLVEDTGSITYSSITLPTSPFDVGKTYKVVITDLNVTSGAFELKYGRTHSSTPARPVITSADNGTYVEYFEAVNDADDITINNLGDTFATLSSISIKEVDPNNRWNNIDDKLTFVNNGGKLSGNSSGLARLYAVPAPTSAGKTYKVSYTVVENNSSVLQHYDGDSYETITSTVGDHSFIYTRQGSNNNFILRNASSDSAFIILTNIMLQEKKYVASNLKLKSGNYTPFAAGQSSGTFALKNYYRMGDGILDKHPIICDMMQPSLGGNLVVNGNFASDDNWTAGSNWDFTENLAVSDGSQTGNVSLKQSNSVNNFVTGKLYKVEFTISNYVGGVINPHVRGQASGNVAGNGLKTVYITAGSSTDGINLYADANFAGSISNVTAKQVNGVAGIMTNMSASNITNDVPRLS